MFFYEGQFCPVCGKPFNESDDVVACPQCGCPHHRGCWKNIGHCYFEADHGTPNQWAQGKSTVSQKTNEQICPRCGTHNPEFAEFCAGCGNELITSENAKDTYTPPVPQYTPPVGKYTPPYGNAPFRPDAVYDIPENETIEGVPVSEIAALVGNNAHYYLPRFLKMSRGGSKVSWNWAAFLLPYNWLLYRKNILFGIVVFVFTQALSLIFRFAATPLQPYMTATTPDAMMEEMITLMSDPRLYLLMCIATVALVLTVAVRILLGLFGTHLYMRRILKKAHQIQDDPTPQYNRHFHNVGGTSFLFAIAPDLITTLFAYALTMIGL